MSAKSQRILLPVVQEALACAPPVGLQDTIPITTDADKVWGVLHRVIKARRGGTFTTDDWWDEAKPHEIPVEHRSIGSVVRAARKQGLITSTGRFVSTQRTVAHGRAIQVWAPV